MIEENIIDLYEQYALEREGMYFVRNEFGFASYKKISDDMIWLVDLYVIPTKRLTGIGYVLSGMVAKKAIELGATKLLGSVDITAKNVTASLKAVLADGFEYSSSKGNMLYFVKELKGV
jgi:hypothetical protein